MKTKGEVEAEISEAMVQFEVEYMGRGPKEVRSFIIEDMILVRLKGVLTQAEQQLQNMKGRPDQRLRTTLIKNARPVLFRVIGDICGMPPVTCTDISGLQ
jgi:uncharacterized protein YbcI